MAGEPFNRDVYVVLIFAGDAVDTDLSSMHILHQAYSMTSYWQNKQCGCAKRSQQIRSIAWVLISTLACNVKAE